jgi:hypothetical protein
MCDTKRGLWIVFDLRRFDDRLKQSGRIPLKATLGRVLQLLSARHRSFRSWGSDCLDRPKTAPRRDQKAIGASSGRGVGRYQTSDGVPIPPPKPSRSGEFRKLLGKGEKRSMPPRTAAHRMARMYRARSSRWKRLSTIPPCSEKARTRNRRRERETAAFPSA